MNIAHGCRLAKSNSLTRLGERVRGRRRDAIPGNLFTLLNLLDTYKLDTYILIYSVYNIRYSLI